MLTLRQMRYFDALATTLHFGRAAKMTNVSQPALSAQIMEMESDLGIRLVERGRSGVILTPHGETLLPEIRAILLAVDGLYDRARQSTGVLEGRLRLGIIPTVAPYLVPTLIPMLRQRYPKLNVELRELLTTGCVDDVKHGKLDCAIIALPHNDDSLRSCTLFEDRFLIASADDENTVLLSPMTEAQVDMDRLLLLEEGHCLRDQALAVCGSTAGRRVANYGATSMATLLQMVSHGMGITLIPEIAVKDERTRNRMRIVPFADPQPSRRIGLVWRPRSGRNNDQEALAALITEAAAELLEG
ncbi:hydrogen peroxide-inducible genes activator [Pararhizobium antarcticum]|uniref:HTH-type transcriptional regulator TtuA n=1 Tax=Pararhizobium antarcticum TaxID=1798805 RepID=A0A657LYP9_9HYPH|nr:hydrogen peroxide-inducible genes activator [Pararhizobium antarcticum]OJF90343.1 LysR family transcriptional regulator [Rhizobium sp. 58]OJG00595.1 LysR family transcriptional regulator [Pararhizobium antarcticum]